MYATDSQIQGSVYEVYGLKEEEVGIVEEGTRERRFINRPYGQR